MNFASSMAYFEPFFPETKNNDIIKNVKSIYIIACLLTYLETN